MRSLLFLIAIHLPTLTAESPVQLFQSCAYTTVLPGHQRQPETRFFLQMESLPRESASWDRLFDPRDGFRISVSTTKSGYFYVLQDPADPGVLVFPEKAQGDDNFVLKGVDRSLPGEPLRFTAGTPLRLLMVFSYEMLPDLGGMTVQQAREYLVARARCGQIFLEERALKFRPHLR